MWKFRNYNAVVIALTAIATIFATYLSAQKCDTAALNKNISHRYDKDEKTKRVIICLYWTEQVATMNKMNEMASNAGTEGNSAFKSGNKTKAAKAFSKLADSIIVARDNISKTIVPKENILLNKLCLYYYCGIIELFQKVSQEILKMNTTDKTEYLSILENALKSGPDYRIVSNEMIRLRDKYKLDEIDLEKEMKKH